MKAKALIFSLLLVTSTIYSQKSLIQSGPMVGYSQMMESVVWIQTNESADVKMNYWLKGDSSLKMNSELITTKKQTAFTAKLLADDVKPGNTYEYEIVVNGRTVDFDYPLEFQTQKLWQWRGDAPDFEFVIGSCFYVNEPDYDRPGKGYGSEYEIVQSIHEKNPDFMIWLGDNIYLREVDWNSRTGILHRNTHTRSLPELQPLLASTHHYAIWDDHDFGPNNSNRSFWAKDLTLEAFELFWANPSFGVNGNPGITTYFEWADCEFFLLDNRYYRSPQYRKNTEREIFGEEQIEWLIDALSSSSAPFKFVAMGSQFLNPYVGYENYSTYSAEREKLLNLIEEAGITGVIFFSGDRHLSEISKLERYGTYPLYDITISSLTAGSNTWPPEANYYRVDGTLTQKHNFAMLKVTGPRKNRLLTIKDYDKDGNELWKFEINENDLK
ncbi:MAG: alkaline phosphatase family protein [Melioribacteraceae bacterium]|nr:alkaline phosphatase family protein [Melioribacteraceae bacterium]MCF8264988.1 alkaline phosphatase family protein [Melioribacteraceae bacterium]MCF8431469.1 alkaline phosphatase family protein [Melioribacteraceae bacterium]